MTFSKCLPKYTNHYVGIYLQNTFGRKYNFNLNFNNLEISIEFKLFYYLELDIGYLLECR